MCGIIGFNFHTEKESPFHIANHRGPDATVWGRFNQYTLGHNRLNIVDHNPLSNQPFVSEDGNYIMVFNGEVYNYQILREKLRSKYNFKTESDTEVVLYSFIEKGKDCVHDFIGMFSLAIYDKRKDELFCTRDRLGIKPFNYYHKDGKFIFASEIKAILKALDHKPEINEESIYQYLHYMYVPYPNTMYSNIHKLPPGHSMIVKNGELKIFKYWDANDYIGKMPNIPEEELLEQLDDVLRDAVKLRMIADVELGSFLSGGIDSSSILYYMAENSSKPINTYTLGFKDAPLYDERSDAQLMAEAFGTNHQEIIIEPDAAQLLSKSVFHFDEPFGNPTSLLIHELTKETKKFATVALAGDGGDEIFGGYPRYEACMLFNKVKRVPKSLFKVGASFANLIPESTSGNHTLRRAKVFVNSLSKPQDEMYEDWIGYYSDKELNQLFKIYKNYKHVVLDSFNNVNSNDLIIKASITDLQTFLPNNLLTYGDAMSMANAFEVRFPLIDHRVIELLTSVSSKYRIKNGVTKYLMRKLFKDRLPKKIVDKPKLGLNPPMGMWLKKDLVPLINQYLSKEVVEKRGYFNYNYIQQVLKEHKSSKKDRSLHIWGLIVLEEWFKQNVD